MDKVLSIKHKVSGRVIHGDHFGRKLGFPTANLDRQDYNRRKLNIKFGVWGGSASLQTTNNKLQTFLAAIVIGPVDKKGLPKIEAHLLGFKGSLYGKKIIIQLQKFVRPFKKFKNIEDLKNQIKEDIKKVK